MSMLLRSLLSMTMVVIMATPTLGQWVQFADETGSRLDTSQEPATGGPLGDGVFNSHEKDYAWGDVDADGDIDLVIVNKQIGTSPGRFRNALLMNEAGVLVDRTTQFASHSTVMLSSGQSQGFLDLTNDRDVALVDVNGDGWLDIVTATTLSGGAGGTVGEKAISHPRVYINRGEDGGNNWLGFTFDDANRFPTMPAEPRFCSVSTGDLDGDGDNDMYMGDYQQGGTRAVDLNDRLLFNDGNGYFTDMSTTCLGSCPNDYTGCPTNPAAHFPCEGFGSSFAMATVIADMNNDGYLDILKDDALNAPQGVSVTYNNLAGLPGREGYFENDGGVTAYELIYAATPYHIAVGDLNNDNLLDLVVTDDFQDRYQLNSGIGADGRADWAASQVLTGSTNEFGGNNLIVDLDNDGFNDVVIANVDVDLTGNACVQSSKIFHNHGFTDAGNFNVNIAVDGTPASIGIAAADLIGGHDIAVFDINGDGWLDMVIGNCVTTKVYINQPPLASLAFSYPNGRPVLLSTTDTTTLQVQVNPSNGGAVTAAALHYDTGGGFQTAAMTALGGGLFEGLLPSGTCLDPIAYYVTADEAGGGVFSDPTLAPAVTHSAMPVGGMTVAVDDDFEGTVSGWLATADASVTSGAWAVSVPVGTVSSGEPAEPPASFDGTRAFLTQGCPGGGCGSAGSDDVDGGPVILHAPIVDLDGGDAIVSYARWFYSSGADVMTVAVTANANSGTPTWVTVETVPALSNSWQVASFLVSDYVTPSANVRVRFVVSDNPNNSVVEGAIDRYRVESFVCDTCTDPADCDDGLFCNGAEGCSGNSCVAGASPCVGQFCDEGSDSCVDCLDNGHCDDGSFCNGAETCSGSGCVAGSDPCAGSFCDEGLGCVACLENVHCDDAQFCNGVETCNAGGCGSGAPPCSGACDEANDVCVGPVELQPRVGDPIRGLTAVELDRFTEGKDAFTRVFTAGEGLGPVFNQASCGSCHNNPVGGSGNQSVTRFGYLDPKDGSFDPLAAMGGSLLQAQTITPACAETIPAAANLITTRATPSILGGGLIESLEDAVLQANETSPPSVNVSGRAHVVQPLEGGPQRVGRFGWKAQVATLLTFAGDAGLNELGITNDLVPTENAPNGDAALLATCDMVADPEDNPPSGPRWIDQLNDFQRFLAQPPQTPRFGMSGEGLFTSIGCTNCHISTYVTSADVALEDALRSQVIRPYSDFLLHDMGLLFDGVADGAATPGEIRTPALWGLRVRDPMLHDASVSGGTFQSRVTAAILAHGQAGSEAAPSVAAFQALSTADRNAVIAFLDSLGRAEFDFNGDGLVNFEDYNQFDACFTGPGDFYTPDDLCSIGDIDQDGDIDDDDLAFLLLALEDCCDLDGNGIRNDACTWCSNEGGCNNLVLNSFGDMGGSFGACAPDQFTNVHDRNHALTCFSNTNPCNEINIDAGGAFGACNPDGFCNIHDANHALTVFAGTSSCSCPTGPMPEFPVTTVGSARVVVERSRTALARKGELAFDVSVEGQVALQGYQLDVQVSGGTAGTLDLVEIRIDERKDRLFAGRTDVFDAFNLEDGRMLAGLDADHGVNVDGRAYLATFIYRASADATGRFVVDVLADEAAGDQTFLVAPANGRVEVGAADAAVIDLRTR